jgi:hypothetical protein
MNAVFSTATRYTTLKKERTVKFRTLDPIFLSETAGN